jgi:uncharacterized protein with NRDE domain
MCTILAAVGVWPDAPLVIAANRDEQLDRAATGPQLWPQTGAGPRRVLAPRDLVAGGTWLGLNDAGVFVGITNRFTPAIDRSRRSRGELVAAALAAGDHRHARALTLAIDARAYNPFHLLVADRSGAAIVWSDGASLHELALAPGLHWLTERSFGAAPSGRHEHLTALARSLAAGPLPRPDVWRSMLADHGQAEPPQPSTIGFDAMCVHALPRNYGTRSSTLIELGREPGAVRFFHAPGRPCETAFVEHPELVAGLFAAPELE